MTFSPPHPRLVFFDLDGTLIDSSRDLAAAANHSLRMLDVPTLPASEIRSYIGDGLRNLMLRCLGGDEDHLDDAIKIFLLHYERHLLDHTLLYPGIERMLLRQRKRERAMVILSNKPESFCRQILEGLGIASYFQIIAGGDTFPTRKPSPAPLLSMLTDLDCMAGDAGIVGDGPQDIQAGRAAGISTCGVLWGYSSLATLQAESPTRIFHNPESLDDWLDSSRRSR